MHLHLAAPETGTQFPSGGKITPMEGGMPVDLTFGEEDSWSASRHVHAGAEGDDRLGVSLQLGNLRLEGRGQRGGFRCRAFVGKVLKDDHVIGSFAMRLTLPIKTDVAQLERQYVQRIAARKPSPPPFQHAELVGRWKLLLNIMVAPGTALAAYFPVEVYEDGSWSSYETQHTLAGTWGVYPSRDALMRTGWSPSVPLILNHGAGNSMRLTVHADESTKTGLGLGGLPINFNFLMLGRPSAETTFEEEEEEEAEAEAFAGAVGMADNGMHQTIDQTIDFDVEPAHDPAPTLAAQVEGRLWTEDVTKGSFGMFLLHRDEESGWGEEGVDELEEECEQGDDIACEQVSVEDEAKRAWLARLELELSRKSTWPSMHEEVEAERGTEFDTRDGHEEVEVDRATEFDTRDE